jgi:hypothetical protein
MRALPYLILPLLSASVIAHADRNQGVDRFILAGPTFGQAFLGSEDIRRGGFYGFEYAKPEPRFRWRTNRAQMVWEGYFLSSKGQGFDNLPVNHTNAFGGLVLARYWKRGDEGLPTYFELGCGLQWASMPTQDLDSQLSSTPVIGVGVAVPFEGQELLISARIFHISNAGTKGSNQGQNQFHFLVGLRF